MSRRDLEDLLERIEDTREIVLGPVPHCGMSPEDELFAVWDAARMEAQAAYEQWFDAPGADSYAVYRAAADRADAAADALAATARR